MPLIYYFKGDKLFARDTQTNPVFEELVLSGLNGQTIVYFGTDASVTSLTGSYFFVSCSFADSTSICLSASNAISAAWAPPVSSVSASFASFAKSGSFAIASHLSDISVSSSFAIRGISSSFALSSNLTNTASFAVFGISASFALASHLADSASFATSGISSSFALNAHLSDSSSYSTNGLSASFGLASHLSDIAISASFATRTISSSFALAAGNADSSSYSANALSTSFSLTAHNADVAGTSTSASFATRTISSSFALSSGNADSASFSVNGISASYALNSSNAGSASYSTRTLSSSFALNSGNSDSASFSTKNISSSFALSSANSDTSSFALTASVLIGSVVSASFAANALSASFALSSHLADSAISASFATSTISASFALAAHLADSASFSTRNISSSFALSSANSDTASYATTGQSASYALNASNAGSASFASRTITSSFASNSANADSASFSNRSISSSFALSAASADSASFSTRNISSSFALNSHATDSSSYSTSGLSSSFALAAHLADSASYSTNALSASFALASHNSDNATSASFAITAAFAMNGGGGATVSNRLVWYPMVQGLKIQQNNAITQSQYEIPGGFIDDYEDLLFVSASGPFTQFNSTGGYISNKVVSSAPSGDIYYFSCSLIYPFNGLNGAQGTTDYSVNNLSASFNNAQIDSSTFETGTSSLLCSATPFNLEIPSGLAGTSFDISLNQDFTIEGWYKFTTISANDTLWSMGPAAPLLWAISDTSLYFRLEDSPFGRDHQTPTGVISTGPWYHIAFTRQGTGANNCTVWVNGVNKFNFTDTGSITRMGNFTLGYLDGSSNAGFAHNGWIDDFRWTVGVARYSASFDTASVTFGTTPFTGSIVGGGGTGSLISNFRVLNYSPTTTYAVLPVKVYSGSFSNIQVGITTDSGSTYTSMSLTTESLWKSSDTATKVLCGAFVNLNTGSQVGYKVTVNTASLVADFYGIGFLST